MDRLLFLQPGGVKVPVNLEVFKHGGGLYLAAVNHELGIHVPFVATAAVLAAELHHVLQLVEAANAVNDQGHISRPSNQPPSINSGRNRPVSQPTLADLNGDPRHDFPVFVRRFAKSSPDIVAAIAQVYKTKGYKVPGMDAILQGYDDLDSVWPIRLKVVNATGELVYGARNRIAKALGIRDAGNYRQRIDTVVWLLKYAPLEDYGSTLEVSESEVRSFGPKAPVSNGQQKSTKAA